MISGEASIHCIFYYVTAYALNLYGKQYIVYKSNNMKTH